MKILAISSPFEYTGGQKRNRRALKEYARNGLSIDVIVPYSGLKYFCDHQQAIKEVNSISDGLRAIGYLYTKDKLKFYSILPETNKLRLLKKFQPEYDLIFGMHENLDVLYWSVKFSEMFDTRSAILLHNPPFYSKKKRKVLIELYYLYKDLFKELTSDLSIFTLMNLHL